MEIVFILLTLALSMFVGAILGFGDTLIFLGLAAFFLDIRVAVVIMGFWSLVLSSLNAMKYRSFIDKPYLKKFIVAGVIGIVLGSLLIVVAPVKLLEFIIGVFIIGYFIVKVREIKNKPLDEATLEVINIRKEGMDVPEFWFQAGSFSYGFFGGLIGASGPFNVVLLERTGHERESFIGNFAICSVCLSPIRVGIYLGGGLFPLDYLLIFVIGIGVIVIITKLGHLVTPKISKDKFMIIVLIFLFIIGIKMIVSALFF